MDQSWTPLTELPPDRLADPRLQAHWAAQIVASIGYTFVDPAPEWTHLSLSLEEGRLRSQSATSLGFFASLDVGRLVVALHNSQHHTVDEFRLKGRTLNDGYAWLASTISSLHLEIDFEIIRPES